MTKSPAEIFTELTGGCWHEWSKRTRYKTVFGHIRYHNRGRKCIKCGISYSKGYRKKGITYSNPADILRKMKEFLGEERYKEFINSFTSYTDFRGWKTYMPTTDFINRFILNTTALLDEAIEFLRSGK